MAVKLSSLGLLAPVVLWASASQANAQPYNFTDLGTLGGTYSSANAINNRGQVAGTAAATDGTDHATLWNGAKATDLGPGAAHAINNSGQVAGTDGSHATVWNGAKATNLGAGIVYAINNAGQVAGTDGSHATVWNGAIATDLGVLDIDYDRSSASAINDIGQVAGWSSVPAGPAGSGHAAVLWNGTILPSPSTMLAK